MSALAAELRARILADGPLRLDAWMAACNSAYYGSRDPFGKAGDFVTAPEISQMFGEMIGGWIGDIWLRAGAPANVRLVELGPGRGTLMRDALRVVSGVFGSGAGIRPALVEISPVLRRALAGLGAELYGTLAEVPDDGPLILVANEFFDALPIRQFLGAGQERGVGLAGEAFVPVALPSPPVAAGEVSEPGLAIAAEIGARLRRHGGAALIIDYGHDGAATGDSLQALHGGAMADPFAAPGESDLTAHVDFGALARAAGAVRVSGPVTQGVWLTRLGIEARARQLAGKASPAQAAAVMAGLVRLTAPAQMGALFKAMALSAPEWPLPAGFDA